MKEINEAQFSRVLAEATVPVLVDFWAPWCGPCRAMAPVLEGLAGEYAGKLEIYKLNVDDNPKIPEQFSIRSIPTLIIFSNSSPVERVIGAVPKGQLKNLIDKALADK